MQSRFFLQCPCKYRREAAASDMRGIRVKASISANGGHAKGMPRSMLAIIEGHSRSGASDLLGSLRGGGRKRQENNLMPPPSNRYLPCRPPRTAPRRLGGRSARGPCRSERAWSGAVPRRGRSWERAFNSSNAPLIRATVAARRVLFGGVLFWGDKSMRELLGTGFLD